MFTQIAIFFSQMAVVTFGGAYAVLAWVAQEAVQNFGWLQPGEMLDGLGMAETTPGPLIMVVQFVGFMAAFRHPGALDPMLAATLGAMLTTWVTFVPCFLWIFLGAPFIERLRSDPALTGAMSAITAAVVGVILNLAIWFALHVLFRELDPWSGYGIRLDMPRWSTIDLPALVLTLAAILAVFRFRAPMPMVLLAAALAGAAWKLAWYRLLAGSLPRTDRTEPDRPFLNRPLTSTTVAEATGLLSGRTCAIIPRETIRRATRPTRSSHALPLDRSCLAALGHCRGCRGRHGDAASGLLDHHTSATNASERKYADCHRSVRTHWILRPESGIAMSAKTARCARSRSSQLLRTCLCRSLDGLSHRHGPH